MPFFREIRSCWSSGACDKSFRESTRFELCLIAMKLPAGDFPVSVVIPCLNEEEPIADVVREVLAQGVDEVVVVDNGSTDRTAERAAAAGARVVSEPTPGYGRACATGFNSIDPRSEIVCFLDGD